VGTILNGVVPLQTADPVKRVELTSSAFGLTSVKSTALRGLY